MLADILHTHRHADHKKCPRCVLVPLDFVTRRRGYYRHSGLVFFNFAASRHSVGPSLSLFEAVVRSAAVRTARNSAPHQKGRCYVFVDDE